MSFSQLVVVVTLPDTTGIKPNQCWWLIITSSEIISGGHAVLAKIIKSTLMHVRIPMTKKLGIHFVQTLTDIAKLALNSSLAHDKSQQRSLFDGLFLLSRGILDQQRVS